MTNFYQFKKVVKLLLLTIIGLHQFNLKATSTLVDIENKENHITMKKLRNAQVIESCIDGICQIFPHKKAHLLGFKGNKSQWEEYFNHCSQFQHLSNLVIGTEIITSIPMIAHLASQKALLFGSKIMTGLLLGSTKIALPKGHGYPSVSKDEVQIVKNKVSVLTKKKKVVFYEFKDDLINVTNALNDCSHDFIRVFERREYLKQLEKLK